VMFTMTLSVDLRPSYAASIVLMLALCEWINLVGRILNRNFHALDNLLQRAVRQ